ncbi:MAG: uracil-DNA glycosylase [Rikenellaceae bacterium]
MINNWNIFFAEEQEKPYYKELQRKLKEERDNYEVFPAESEVFTAFNLCAPEDVKVVIIGQDPYHDNGQAHGLAFSVAKGMKFPPSLRNIFNELHDDLGKDIPEHGDLSLWAEQGVLLINATLTVRAHEANSHKSIGWSKFTDSLISYLNTNFEGIVYVAWGAFAYKKCEKVDMQRNRMLVSSHPSPLSNKKFFKEYPPFTGSKPFSKINALLEELGKEKIEW